MAAAQKGSARCAVSQTAPTLWAAPAPTTRYLVGGDVEARRFLGALRHEPPWGARASRTRAPAARAPAGCVRPHRRLCPEFFMLFSLQNDGSALPRAPRTRTPTPAAAAPRTRSGHLARAAPATSQLRLPANRGTGDAGKPPPPLHIHPAPGASDLVLRTPDPLPRTGGGGGESLIKSARVTREKPTPSSQHAYGLPVLC
jgi:hypothetical protein